MNFFQQLINQKLRQLTVQDLMHYSQIYQIPITREQAEKLVHLAKTENINAFNEQERQRLLNKITQAVGPDLANQMNALFKKLTGM